MKKLINVKRKVLPLFLAGITTATVLTPVTAMADDSTGEISISEGVVTVAAHRAAETAPMILGANLITTDGVNDVMLETFGSDYNIEPNQYLYNTGVSGKYSEYYGTDGRIWKLEGTVAPTMADLYYGSVETGADIYLGNAVNNGSTYSSSLYSMAYGCTTIEDMENTMTTLAAAIDAKGTGLYGSASAIATKYVNYIEKTVSYVNANKGSTKKVAILAKSNGSYILYTSEYNVGTSINRAAEYLEDVTYNLVDDYISYDSEGNKVVDSALVDNKNGSYTLNDKSILENANVVITTGFQGASTITAKTLEDDGITLTGTLFNTLPDSSYGIYMNSAENALGMVGLIMAIYENSGSIKVDCEDAVAYYYSNFYHIDDKYIDDLANKHFAGCINYSSITEESVASDIAAYAAIVE